ncbi:MAG: amino acid adenylation domain-containing protein [Leptolyngbyaceae cyanobacterium]
MVFTDSRNRLLTVKVENQVSVCRLFEAQARKRPEALAIEDRGQCWTYQALNTYANQLAHYLRERRVGPNVLVGLYLERSFEMIVGVLAILKAGGAYVPLDPSYPRERLDWMLKDSQIQVLLTQQPLGSNLLGCAADVICFKTDWPIVTQKPKHNLTLPTASDLLAYVIYTSGSTGKPKGVMVGQQALANFVSAANRAYGVVPSDRVLQFASISFDAAIEEIFLTLTQGATLVLRTQAMLKSIPDFLQACEALRITVLDLPTAFWHQLCACLDTVSLASTVRLTIIGGERALLQWLTVWKRCVSPRVSLVNTYGPTETTVVATYCYLTGSDAAQLDDLDAAQLDDLDAAQLDNVDTVPIGRPLANLQTHILDRAMKLLPQGSPGELYISGPSLAQGYLNRADLTAKRFITLATDTAEIRLYKTGDLARYRDDGYLEYLGRTDDQIKIRGFRVELQEIENVLMQHPAVQGAVVVAQETSLGQSRLVAYVANQQKSFMAQKQSCDRTNQSICSLLEQEQINQWQAIHNDDHLNTVDTAWDNTFNISGWTSSYTGQLLPAAEMHEWVDNTVERILNLRPESVLELGCGTGLLLFQIAPHCKRYVGTDISDSSLGYVKKQLANQQLASQVTLQLAAADNFKDVKPGSYDTVILNSVLQYFPNIGYLVNVLERAVRSIKPGGALFIGDVRNYCLQEAFATSIELFNAPDDLSIQELRQRIQKRINQEEELTVDPSFFLALQKHLPQISQVQILLKQSRFHNELTQFRYDVVLHVGSTPQAMLETVWTDWYLQNVDLANLRQQLKQPSTKALGFRNIPNARVSKCIKVADLLNAPHPWEYVVDLKTHLLNDIDIGGVDPEALRQLACELNLDVMLSWPSIENKGAFNALFRPQPAMANANPGNIESLPASRQSTSLQSWSFYANNPLQPKIAQTLSTELRAYAEQTLPKYMVPSTFVIVETFPLSANGKIDHKALPIPDTSRPELSVPFVQPCTSQAEKLADIWSDVLDVFPIGINDSFFELGGDSLRLMQLMTQVERLFEVTISFADFFKQPTIANLSSQLSHKKRAANATEFMSVAQLHTEARFTFEPPSYSWSRPQQHWTKPKTVLLTGATGFIGRFLLQELLQKTDATVYCLVRSATNGRQQLQQSLRKNIPNIGSFDHRIKPLIGDLTLPEMGLTQRQFEYLAENVDVIYHIAANVNLFYPYAALKPTNIVGTQSVLTLASQSKLKPVHYVSTLDVFESLATTCPSIIYENDSITQGIGISGGYAQSKWVAEQLITRAATAGIPICIYRPGMVSGHTQTGLCNPTDLMCRFLSSIIQLKSVPNLNWAIDMTPVDYVSQAIVNLSLQPQSFNQAFHLVNPNPYPLSRLVDELRHLGYAVEYTPYDQWQNSIRNHQTALSPLAKIITEVLPGHSLTRLEMWLAGTQMFDCQNTLQSLSQTSISCPPIDIRLLEKYMANLNQHLMPHHQ